MSTFFSIIIPTYNRSLLVSRAIESVLAQSFEDFEVIVVDDGSTDDTREYLQKFQTDPRFRYIYQDNAKESAARNNGVRQSKGKFICFLDSDDYYLEHHLQELYNVIQKNEEKPAFYHTLAYKEDESGERVKRQDSIVTESNPIYYVYLNKILPINVCLNREIALAYPFRVDIYNDEDSELFYRIVDAFPIIPVPVHTVVYYQHKLSSNEFYNKSSDYYDNRIQSLDIYLNSPKVLAAFPKGFFEKMKSNNLVWCANALLREGKKKQAIENMKASRQLLQQSSWDWSMVKFRLKALLK